MKCQRCPKQATLHITEVLDDQSFEELHLCEECAQKYLHQQTGSPKSPEAESERDELAVLNQRECPQCGIKFAEFRSTGRLGCPHDYEAFREELMPLLENIHGETRHAGKTPRRFPQTQQAQSEMLQLRKQLQAAVTKEAYEEAARIRDQIR